MRPIQKLALLRNKYALLNSRKKRAEPVHREMVQLVCKQLRREIREDRRKSA